MKTKPTPVRSAQNSYSFLVRWLTVGLVALAWADSAPAQTGPPAKPDHAVKAQRGRIYGVAFHPDGQELAMTSRDGTAKVLDAATGQVKLTLEGHASEVLRIAY